MATLTAADTPAETPYTRHRKALSSSMSPWNPPVMFFNHRMSVRMAASSSRITLMAVSNSRISSGYYRNSSHRPLVQHTTVRTKTLVNCNQDAYQHHTKYTMDRGCYIRGVWIGCCTPYPFLRDKRLREGCSIFRSKYHYHSPR